MMDEMERRKKAVASLPPDYVSLAMLKERWLQKQKEKKLLEEEQKQREEEDNLNEEALKSENDVPAVVGEIEPENAIEQMGGFGNGERKKKWRKRYKEKKKQPLVDHEEKQNPRVGDKCCFERVDGEMKRSNGYKKVEIIRGNELTKVGTFHDERGRIFGKSVVVGFPRDGVRGEDSKVKSDTVRGGFRRNATDGGTRRRRKGYRVKVHEFKDNEAEEVVDGKGDGNGFVKRRRNRRNRRRGHKNKECRGKLDNLKVNEAAGMSWGRKVGDEKEKVKNGTDRRRNGDNRKIEYSWKGRGTTIMQGFKGNEVEPKLEHIEAGSKVDGLNGIDRNGLVRQYHRVERESLKDTTNSIVWDGVSAVDRGINGKNWDARNGFRSDGSRRGNVGRKLGRLAFNNLSAGNPISSMELNVGNNRRYGSSGRSKVWKTRQNNWGMLWVKKEEKSSADAAEIGS